MKEPITRSPFAALDSREQKERWICWQSQHLVEQPAQAPTNSLNKPRSILLLTEPTQSRFAQTSRGSEYTSVVRRIQQATQRAQHYVSWSPDEESTKQPSSGS